MIYDKNQFWFNLLLTFMLIAAVAINVIFGINFIGLNRKYQDINMTLVRIESNQDFNFLQGAHSPIEYYMSPQGLYISSANDYGVFTGPSMQPAIFDQNTLIERKYDGTSRLTEGQIVRYLRKDGTAVIHRIRADYGVEVYVQGDSLKDGEIIEKARISHIIIGVLFT